MTGGWSVRHATSTDADLVTSIVASAFTHDPLWAHAMARPDGETAHHALFWRLIVEGALRYPDTWLASEGEATCIWIPPGGMEMTPEQERCLADLAAEYLGPAVGDFLELLSRFEAAHPRGEPHYYLSLLGTHPEHRGKGIGMRLLAHVLGLIDAEHLPAPGVHQPGKQSQVRRCGFRAARRVPVSGRRPSRDDHVASGPLRNVLRTLNRVT